MPPAFVGAIVMAHGLITTMIGLGAITKPDAPAMAVPAWFSWWPGPFGRSWLIDGLHLGTPGSVVGGALWLVAGILLIAAGLGWLGATGVRDSWQTLAAGGAAIGLVALALYFHPLYLVAVLIDLAIVTLAYGALSPAR